MSVSFKRRTIALTIQQETRISSTGKTTSSFHTAQLKVVAESVSFITTGPVRPAGLQEEVLVSYHEIVGVTRIGAMHLHFKTD